MGILFDLAASKAVKEVSRPLKNLPGRCGTLGLRKGSSIVVEAEVEW